ncbi:hypothetical protein [Methylobacterium sp. E-045]|uniref:hypothetical protein n=1 Tax=Methylobacterium sp. E-045 TaxID=2836575 RepID=UPI001FB90C74|nr:hypothetical protein [Methylobacterium sp. E-045]MCJ2128655.1 hypothetical protein [Methylobacterium sp. E-045]
MSAFFNSDGSFPLQFLIIFAVIFAVLAAIVLVFRRFSGRGMALSKSGPRGRQPRLGIVDIYELDRQRQLILLRRDNVEHLLLVGGPNDVIVERNIHRGAGARLPLDEAARVESLLEEPVFEPARPADPPAPAAPPVMQPPIFDEPRAPAPEPAAVVNPPAEPRGDVPPETKPASRFTKADMLAAKAARRSPPPLANLKPETPDRPRPTDTRPDAAAEPTVPAVELPKQASVPEAPPAPVPPAPVPPAVIEAPGLEKAARPQPAIKPVPVAEQAPAVPPPLVRPTSSRPVDAAILSDMARQLEEALRRPSAAISPSSQAIPATPPTTPPKTPLVEPSVAAKPEPRPEPAAAETAKADQPIDPMAAAMAAPSDSVPDEAPTPKAQPVTAQPAPAGPVFAETGPSEAARREPASTAPDEFLPAPPPPPIPQTVPAPSRTAPASQNPFSVEEIEAEFARLLGRPLDRKG